MSLKNCNRKYIIRIALAEEALEGFVWSNNGFDSGYVKIKCPETNKRIYTWLRSLDERQERKYNKRIEENGSNSTKKIDIKSDNKYLIISEYYRLKLGINSYKNKEVLLEIKSATNPCHKICSYIKHPNPYIKLGAWLGVISVLLGVYAAIPTIKCTLKCLCQFSTDALIR